MNLTANFTLAEMVKSETALRHDMDNTPGETEIENLKRLCEQVLQPVREHFKTGVKVNSGFRHPEVNAKVGGSKTSDHCKGQAADIEIPGVPNAELAEYIATCGVGGAAGGRAAGADEVMAVHIGNRAQIVEFCI